MSEETNLDQEEHDEEEVQRHKRREFLGSLGKWSGASTIAAVGGAAWLATPGTARAGSWINRRYGGGWINGGGGGWVNGRYGGGSWINGGGGGWINRRGGGGWINRR